MAISFRLRGYFRSGKNWASETLLKIPPTTPSRRLCPRQRPDMQTSRKSLPKLHLLSSPRRESKRTKNFDVSAMCCRQGAPRTKRGLGNSSQKDRFVTFSDVANNPICIQNGVLSTWGERKCSAMVLLKVQRKEHLGGGGGLSAYRVRFASKWTVLPLSKIFTYTLNALYIVRTSKRKSNIFQPPIGP